MFASLIAVFACLVGGSSDHIVEEETKQAKKQSKKQAKEADDWLDNIICTSVKPATKTLQEQIEDEVNRYISQPVDRKVKPLEWWKSHEVLYPRVARLAKEILAIPASSVPSERIFSLGTNLVTKHRNHLASENVDLLIFLHKNT